MSRIVAYGRALPLRAIGLGKYEVDFYFIFLFSSTQSYGLSWQNYVFSDKATT